jgi:pyruvate-formate lyase
MAVAAPHHVHRSPQKRIDVRDFIQQNYHPYEGDESVLAAATQRTRTLESPP